MPHVARQFHSFEHAYIRLAACTEGEIAGVYRLPIRGNWSVQFFVGVPEYDGSAYARVASFPTEPLGKPDVTDAMTVTINGESELFHNQGRNEPGGYRLQYIRRFDQVKELHFRFNWTSSSDMDHLHMMAVPGEITYLGDLLPLTKADSFLAEASAAFEGKVVNAADGKPLFSGKVVRLGDEVGFKLEAGDAKVTLFVGSSAVQYMQVVGGEFNENARLGKYVCQVSYPGFYTFYEPSCAVKGATERPVALSPFLNPGDARFILTWGANPPDLELRMDVPLPGYQVPGCTVSRPAIPTRGSPFAVCST